ncbi:GNAT family N-acetyltransferase [Dongia sp.]|uniref:GNAT family N-acetyltransferase n=1 Tax=Dongia sp. TaxID=1977262 RepID=UPI0035B328A4
MDADEFCWRVERVCHLAWPSLNEKVHGDWVFRFSDGLSRRGNSANPLRMTHDIAPMLMEAEAAYPRAGLPTIVRVPSMLPAEVETALHDRGYRAEGETLTLYCDLPATPMRRDPDVTVLARPDEAWLARMWEMKDLKKQECRTYRAIVGALEIPVAFMALNISGEMVAMGYAALHDCLLCVESLITAPHQRGRGFAGRLVGAMLAWGIEHGAAGACLQVAADNEIALKLYRGMGLQRELYRYRYWRAE